MTTINAIVVQIQRSFTKTKTQNNFFLKKFGEFFNIHITHVSQHSMINMALKWHHKNVFNKIIIFIEFWWSPNMFFGPFDCDYTHYYNLEMTQIPTTWTKCSIITKTYK